jgi:carbamoyl-phosphate synthase large subunit
MKKRKLTIAISGLNAIDSPGPGLAVARGLLESDKLDVKLIGLAYESMEPGIFMHDIFHKTYQIPYPSAGTDVLLKRLLEIHRNEKIDLVIPNFDAELFSYIKIEKTLLEKGIHTFLPESNSFEDRQKWNLVDFGKKHKLKVPRSKEIMIFSDFYPISVEYGFPLVVKGKYYDAIVAYNAEQAQSAFNRISAKWGLPIIIQEFIRGQEFNVTGLGDGLGNAISIVPMRKLYITDKGKAWSGISIGEENLLKLTRKFIKSTRWRGGFELELMKNEKNEYSILEINPRLPAWVYLAVGCGQNIPEALALMAMGEIVDPMTQYDVGKMFVRYSWDMIVNLEEFQQISTFGEL